MKRRLFLKLSLGGGLALLAGTTLHRLLFDYEAPRRQLPAAGGANNDGVASCLSAREVVILRAAALRILAGAEPDPRADGAAAQCAFIDRYLAGLDEALRSDVKALLSLLEMYPLLTGRFARFSRLSDAAQDAVLAGWERSRSALLRQGMQAVKAMCMLAHYQDERSFTSIGYSGPLVPLHGLGHILPAP
jgi:hypothetical protein